MVFAKAEWQRQKRRQFRDQHGFSMTSHYGVGGLRDTILVRDGYKCVVCGMTDLEHKERWGRPITIDHINKNRKDNSLVNLRTMCLHCHGSKDITPRLITPRVPAYKTSIMQDRQQGRTYQSIADSLGFSIAAIWKWCQRWEQETQQLGGTQ